MESLSFLIGASALALFVGILVGIGIGANARPDTEYKQWLRGYCDGFRHALTAVEPRLDDEIDAGLATGREVIKVSGSYGGPGIVRGAALTVSGEPRLVVGHKLADGFGEMLHIYRPQDIAPVAAIEEAEA